MTQPICTCTELEQMTVCHDIRNEPHLVGCPRWGTPKRDDRMTAHCRLGYEEHDGTRYCFEHGGFAASVIRKMTCDRRPVPLPLHRTEAGYPRCATCDGGGCHDCTDPA